MSRTFGMSADCRPRNGPRPARMNPGLPGTRGGYAITMTTTRRFWARPSRLVFGATGAVGP